MKESSKLSLDLHFLEMDLQSLQSVKVAAEEFMKRESQLDLLINNASVSILKILESLISRYFQENSPVFISNTKTH